MEYEEVKILMVNVQRNIFVNTNSFTFCHEHAISLCYYCTFVMVVCKMGTNVRALL